MLRNGAASVVAEGTTKEWFYAQDSQIMFESIRQVFDAGEDVNEVTVLPVLQKLMSKERMDLDTSVSLMMDLPEGMSSAWLAALKNVKNKFIQRNMIHSARKMVENLQQPLASAEDIREALQSPMAELSTLTLADDDKTAKEEITEFVEEKMKEMRGEVEKTPDEYRVYTGMKNMEETLGYIDRRRKDNNITVAARSSRGKSAFMRQVMVENLRKHYNWVIVGFLLESSKEDWWHNTACSFAKINTRQPLNTVDGKKQKMYVQCMDVLIEETDKRLFLFDSPESVEGVVTRCREIAARCGKIDLLCVDYLQILRSTEKGTNREVQVAAMSGGIQRLQKSLSCVAFSGTQLNQNGGARESEAIFNNSTIFWVIDRPEKDAMGQTQQEGAPVYYQTVQQEKCRNGILTTVPIDFHVENQTMTDHV
jgi:replicative DNA helicase